MGFDFFGADVDLKIFLQSGKLLEPGRYSLDFDGNQVRNPEDPDVVRVGHKTQLSVYSSGGPEITLDSTASGDLGLPLPFFRSMMTRFQMEIGFDQMPKLEIDIEPPSNDLALALLNSNVFAFGNTLAVKFGYTKSPNQAFPGKGRDHELFFLLKPDVKFGGAGITYTLRAQGTGLASAQRVQQRETYKSFSPKSLISKLVQRSGLKLKEPSFSGAPGQAEWNAVKDFEQILITDWQFIRQILSSIPGQLTFTIEGDQFIVRSLANRLTRDPLAIFRWGHGININASTGNLTDSDRLPIYDFNSPTDLAFFPMAASGLATNEGVGKDKFKPDTDNTQKVSGQTLNTSDNSDQAKMGDTTLASIKLGKIQQAIIGAQTALPFGAFAAAVAGMQVVQSFVSAPDSRVSAKNFQQASQFAANWEISLDTVGVPTLRPGDLIEIQGFQSVGSNIEKLNGKFLVKQLIHSIDSEGFHTRITGLRNSTPGEGVRTGGPVNNKTAATTVTSTSLQNVFVDPASVEDGAG